MTLPAAFGDYLPPESTQVASHKATQGNVSGVFFFIGLASNVGQIRLGWKSK